MSPNFKHISSRTNKDNITTPDFMRVEMIGVPVDTVPLNPMLTWLEKVLTEKEIRRTIYSINPEKIVLIRKNKEMLGIFSRSSLIIPDGIGIVWAMKQLYSIEIKRVTGIDLMGYICQLSSKHGNRIFVLGGTEKINAKAREELKKAYPSIDIAGGHHGYFDRERSFAVTEAINASGADVLFVAMGSPVQERWIDSNLSEINVKLCMGVGGALDILSGKLKRAPERMRSMGFEWLYRLLQQPWRIGRQLRLMFFAFLVLVDRIKSKH